MRVTLIYRKDQHTDKLGTIELDAPGQPVMLHLEADRGRCACFQLSYLCHTEACKCRDEGDKVKLVECACADKAKLDTPIHEIGAPPESVEPATVRTIGESVADSVKPCDPAVAAMGRKLDQEIMGARPESQQQKDKRTARKKFKDIPRKAKR